MSDKDDIELLEACRVRVLKESAHWRGINMSNAEVLDKILRWRMSGDRRFQCPTYENGSKKVAQIQWRIEIRADFIDKAKIDLLSKMIVQHAVALNANVNLIKDEVKPEVVCYSDDFFHGHKEISLMDNPLGTSIVDQDTPDAELLAAAKGMMSVSG